MHRITENTMMTCRKNAQKKYTRAIERLQKLKSDKFENIQINTI
jgi:hypothetical protein